MRIQINSRGCELGEEQRHRIQRRIEFALGRFATRIQRVTVRLEDENGPRGGLDLACRVAVKLKPEGELHVLDRDEEERAVTDRALDRAARAVARYLERQRQWDVAASPAPAAQEPAGRRPG